WGQVVLWLIAVGLFAYGLFSFAEARIIDAYLPTPLTDAEVVDVVETAIAQVAESLGHSPSMKQMGMVMKVATGIAEGKADGSRLSAAVKDRL
ncbi:GatB/YqeY domain-containing protein, partial [Mycobacterium asiaticum]|uniref:GatB/YqeY domain-containing protein n=1 Tax=Mycobacterium asiaticum TaxID=1790 RepID=UPI000B0BFA60